MSEQIYLSRRNLLTLLSKLDRQAAGESTSCTVIKYRNPGDPYIQSMDTVAVTAVPDDEYYVAREPGRMHPKDEATIDGGLTGYVYLEELPLGHHLYTGEPVGAGARDIFGMDNLDRITAKIVITAPEDTYSISDSFWRGLLEPSLALCGDRESAKRKLQFQGPQQFQASFQAYIVRHFLTRQK